MCRHFAAEEGEPHRDGDCWVERAGEIMLYCIFLEQTFPFMRRQKKCVCVVFTEKNFFLWSGSSGDEWRHSAGAELLRLALIAAV